MSLLDASLLDDSEQKYFSEFLDDILLGPKPEQPTHQANEDKKRGRPKKEKRNLLTENEKRMNHVFSEQRRRKLIKEGFQTLVDLVPNLSEMNNNNHSKSTILFKSADYIKELEKKVELLNYELQKNVNGDFRMRGMNYYAGVPPSFLVNSESAETL